MLSNYPPGVTGFEPEIAGYEEWSEKRECEATVYDENDNESFCDFRGVVDGWVDGEKLRWDCPKCGNEASEDYDVEPPEDWGSDR